jgi:hypothetical protein
LRNHGLKFHHRRFVGQPRAFKPGHFGHLDHGDFIQVRTCSTP